MRLDSKHLLLVLVKPLLLVSPVLEHPVLLGQQLLQDNWGKRRMETILGFHVGLTLDFSLWASEGRLVGVGEVLQASVGVLEEGLCRPSGQSAGLEEGLLLFLVLVDELEDEGGPVVVSAGVAAQPVVLPLVLPLQAVQHTAHLSSGCQWMSVMSVDVSNVSGCQWM